MKRTTLPTLCVLLALLIAACGESATNSNNSNAPAANANANRAAVTTPATTNTPATTASSADTAGEKIGIAECDDFLAKYEACVSGKVPEAARAQYKSALAQWRNSWRQLAANPQTKPTLAQACKTSVEQARTSMKAYGCDF